MIILGMKKRAAIFMAGLLFSGVCIEVVAEGRAVDALLPTCSACHGNDGNSPASAWPKIAGQNREYIIQQIEAFQSGARKNVQMEPIVKDLTKAEVIGLAEYFSSQKTSVGVTKKQHLALGARIYHKGDGTKGLPACVACHGPKGEGNPAAKFPALSGQHSDYTLLQLKAFRSGARNNDANAIMQQIARTMEDKEMEAVSGYIEGLH